jgi:hypothetical protein
MITETSGVEKEAAVADFREDKVNHTQIVRFQIVTAATIKTKLNPMV